MLVDLDTVRILWPEVMLVFLASWMYLGGTLPGSRVWWLPFALGAYAVAGFVLVWKEGAYWAQQGVDHFFLSGPLVVDYFGCFLRASILVAGILLTLLAARVASRALSSEFLATLMLLVVGLMLVARANDLVVLFVGLELVSIPTYVLVYLGRRDRATAEAATKYFFLSILASALLLYGFSFLYGLAGTTTLVGAGEVPGILESGFEAGPRSAGLLQLALVLILSGLGFKLAAVPFHFYAPDVYQGAGHIGAGLLAVAPKVAGVLATIRVLVVALPGAGDFGWQVAMVLAVLTMTLGNVSALWQRNLRRMMAYSSIAHAGYLLIGVSTALWGRSRGIEASGVSATLVYLSVYVLGALGTFAALAVLGEGEREVNGIEGLAGLARPRPWVAASLAVCMFSLAGIPPLAGFWGKLSLFGSALQVSQAAGAASASVWFMLLAAAGAVNAAIAAAYYLRIVAVMYFATATVPVPRTTALGPAAAMFACTVLLLAIGISPREIMRSAQHAERGLPNFRPAAARQAGAPRLAETGDRAPPRE